MTDDNAIQPGVYGNISNADYHGGPGISKSGLDLIRRSPMHYRFATSAANDNEPTAAQFIGTAFHTLLLEPDVFSREYCLALRRQDVPEAIDDREVLAGMIADLNAKRLPKLSTSGSKDDLVARVIAECERVNGSPVDDEGRARVAGMKAAELKAEIEKFNCDRPGLLPTSGSRHQLADLLRANGVEVALWSDVQAQWLENNGQRNVLTPEQWDQLHAMRDAVMAHPSASALMKAAGAAEQSVYWRDAVTGELCRCRPDWWATELNLLVDVKTTDDASPEGFAKSVANWRYHVQAPFYVDGVEAATGKRPKAFLFLAVEKKAPHAVAVYGLSQESEELGRLEYRQDLDNYAACRKSGEWPGYGNRIQSLELPAWYFSRADRAGGGA